MRYAAWPIHRRRLAAATAAALLVAAAALWGYVEEAGSLPGEREFARWAAPRPLPEAVRHVVRLFTLLGEPAVAAATVAVLLAVVAENLGRRAALAVVCASVVALPLVVLETLLPATPLSADLARAAGREAESNYPSGHVAYATAVIGLAAYLAHRHGQRTLTAACCAFPALMGVTRLIAGAHLLSDVLAGYAVGAGWLIGVLLVAAPDRDGDTR